MIKATCRTNLDEYKLVTWPTVFARCPNIGEWVCAREGKTLRVCGITHAEIGGEPQATCRFYNRFLWWG